MKDGSPRPFFPDKPHTVSDSRKLSQVVEYLPVPLIGTSGITTKANPSTKRKTNS
jgi:hypothetical protein